METPKPESFEQAMQRVNDLTEDLVRAQAEGKDKLYVALLNELAEAAKAANHIASPEEKQELTDQGYEFYEEGRGSGVSLPQTSEAVRPPDSRGPQRTT